ncbi:hypothetical protein J4209_04310 [Candidatus Woesearchaeota archaeon]|nr:hypothetical protein [Candidatus Woesearchaeota archaeon]
MVNMTLAIPEDLHKLIRRHNEVKWSEVARKAMWEHAKRLDIMDKLVSKSKLTEKQAEEIGNKLKKEIAKRHGLAG